MDSRRGKFLFFLYELDIGRDLKKKKFNAFPILVNFFTFQSVSNTGSAPFTPNLLLFSDKRAVKSLSRGKERGAQL